MAEKTWDTASEATMWAAALGPAFAARAALVAIPLTPSPPPGGVRSVIFPITKSSKVTFKYGDVKATKFLMRPLFSGCCTN
jgi:hypothetical protein